MPGEECWFFWTGSLHGRWDVHSMDGSPAALWGAEVEMPRQLSAHKLWDKSSDPQNPCKNSGPSNTHHSEGRDGILGASWLVGLANH